MVADDGPGMDPEQVAHVFERFYRSDPSRSRLHGGAGLGLSIVAAIVAAHGGTVTAASILGEGTAFTVRLPAVPPAPLPPESGDRRTAHAGTAPPGGPPRHLLGPSAPWAVSPMDRMLRSPEFTAEAQVTPTLAGWTPGTVAT